MIVKDKHLTTIWYDNSSDKIKIIDQRLLPFDLKIVELKTLKIFVLLLKKCKLELLNWNYCSLWYVYCR